MPQHPAKFVTFEGGEGAGKSTQVNRLAEFLRAEGNEVIITREPGGTPLGEEIRSLLVKGAVDKCDGFTEVLLNFAARNEHVKNVIKPSIEAGKWVLCDRFFDSTVVYQGYGQGQDMEKIAQVRIATLGEFKPDITFLLDMDVDIALERALERGETNRYEKMGTAFHRKIREGFLKLVASDKERFVVVDASKTVDEVHDVVIKGLGL